MGSLRCPLHCRTDHKFTRRDFIRSSTALLAGSPLLGGCVSLWQQKTAFEPMRPCGPASRHLPTIKAAFVRRKGEYGMRWPGAVYDGKAAQKMYTDKITDTAKELGVNLRMPPEAIHSLEEGEAWVADAKTAAVDGLLLVTLDRQEHSWPTARIAAESGIPSIIFSPLGTSFTTNTARLADRPGCVVYSTNDFSQAAYGMKMLSAAAKMRRTRCVVLKGEQRYNEPLSDLGITMQIVPASTFVDEYNRTPDSKEILAMAQDYMRRARRRTGATRQDVINGVKSYYVASKILQNEDADAITMDCLGALGNLNVSLPCIAWSRMNDDGIPAACEADYGAVASHIIVQYLFDRPGFQQDPVADTADDSIIGAHCSCPTRLNGFDQPSEPFDLMPHHGNRDAVPRTLWRIGQRVTSIDLLPGRAASSGQKRARPSKVLISTGTVVENMDVPPSGGCVVSVKVRFDGSQEVLTFPGFHQIFFYGDYGQQVKDFCHLCKLDAQIV